MLMATKALAAAPQQPTAAGDGSKLQALLQAHSPSSPLAKLARAQPDMTSMAFLEWLAAQEATATGTQKRVLDAICCELVTLREVQGRLKTVSCNIVQRARHVTPEFDAARLAARGKFYHMRMQDDALHFVAATCSGLLKQRHTSIH